MAGLPMMGMMGMPMPMQMVQMPMAGMPTMMIGMQGVPMMSPVMPMGMNPMLTVAPVQQPTLQQQPLLLQHPQLQPQLQQQLQGQLLQPVVAVPGQPTEAVVERRDVSDKAAQLQFLRDLEQAAGAAASTPLPPPPFVGQGAAAASTAPPPPALAQLQPAVVPPVAPAPSAPPAPPSGGDASSSSFSLSGQALSTQPAPASDASAIEPPGAIEAEKAVGAAVPAGAGSCDAEKPPEEPVRCHLHSQKKPNLKCKFCQRAQSSSASSAKGAEVETRASAAQGSSRNLEAGGRSSAMVEDYSRRTFNCSPMLKDQIYGSSYFKSLLTIETLEDLIDEIAKYADTLDVYNAGSTNSPSCFISQVYRLFTLPHAEDLGEVNSLIDHVDSPVVRCAGFLYMRFVVPPALLWEKLEEYAFDDMELRYTEANKQVITTIGEYVESLLGREKYFNTPLPRIPVKVRQELEKELAPLMQYRKRMEANLRTFGSRRIYRVPVEIFVDGDWSCGAVKEYVGRLRRKVAVRLDQGGEAIVHLGKVVLREEVAASDSGGESGSEGRGKRRRRASSPDWSRWKGGSGNDMVEALRAKAKDDAVCGYGKNYARRPLTVEEELWKREPERSVSMLGDESRGGSATFRVSPLDRLAEESAAKRKSREDDERERAKRLRDIYEKYGSASKGAAGGGASSSTAASKSHVDVDEPDVLRLG